jgi:hypothetical protein
MATGVGGDAISTPRSRQLLAEPKILADLSAGLCGTISFLDLFPVDCVVWKQL